MYVRTSIHQSGVQKTKQHRKYNNIITCIIG